MAGSRRRATAIALIATAFTVLGCSSEAPAVAAGPAGQVVRYGPAPSQYVEVFLPPVQPGRTGPFPVAVFIHGGCWLSDGGSLRDLRATYADLARRGVAVWAVEYRRIDEPGGAWPGIYQDVAQATDRLRTEAPRLDLDPSRVVVVGHSAGGQLALWAAGRRNLPAGGVLSSPDPLAVDGVFAIAAPAELRTLHPHLDRICGAGVAEGLTGRPTPARPDVFADTSPAELTPLGTPTRLFVGSEDVVVPPDAVRLYADRARARGDDVTEQVIAGADHISVVLPGQPAWTTIADAIAAFLLADDKG